MMSSKETKDKKPLKESEANPKLPTAMTHANLKIQMGKPMLTSTHSKKLVNLVSSFITTTSIITKNINT
jgi:hypothetical protein